MSNKYKNISLILAIWNSNHMDSQANNHVMSLLLNKRYEEKKK